MRVSEELRSSSLFTVGGNSEGIEVIGFHDTNHYDWVCYIMSSIPEEDYWGNKTTPYMNSSLLESMFARIHNTLDYEFLGLVPKQLSVKLAYSTTTTDVTHWANKILGMSRDGTRVVQGNFFELVKGDSQLTPFMGVGTQIPANITWQKLAAAIALCKSPANTYISLVGDRDGALEILGHGLERIRGLILNHLGIRPSPKSVPLDMPIPLVWQHSLQNPTMVEIVASQKVDSSTNTVIANQRKAIIYLSCLLYNILEMDQGYLGLVPGKEYPSGQWCVSSSSSTTVVPYRYPLLVHILASIEDYYNAKQRIMGERSEAVYKKEITPVFRRLITRWGSTTPFSVLSDIGNGDVVDNYLYTLIPKVVKSFCVRLYRLSCKGIIQLPSKRDYPRRSEASRDFVEVYQKYSKRCSLTDYLLMGDLMVSCSVAAAFPGLNEIMRASVNLKAHDALLSDFERPTLPVKGAVTTDTYPTIVDYVQYSARVSKWRGVKVSNEWGVEICVSEQLTKVTLDHLDKLHAELGTNKKYTYITPKQLSRLSGGWGFKGSSITQHSISTSFLKEVTFGEGCVKGLSLECVVEYHREFKHPGTKALLETTYKLLESSVMESYEEAVDLIGPQYPERVLKLCVIQYLKDVLDSTRV